MKLPGTDVSLDDRLKSLLVPIDELELDQLNPRTPRDVAALMRMIQRYGYTDPIVVNAKTKLVEAGHMRLRAVRELGATHIPAVMIEHDAVTGRAFNIAHNRSSEIVAGWEKETLHELLTALRDEDVWDDVGFSDADLDALLASEPIASIPESYEPPPPKARDPNANTEVDIDEFKLQHRCPRCGMEFNDG